MTKIDIEKYSKIHRAKQTYVEMDIEEVFIAFANKLNDIEDKLDLLLEPPHYRDAVRKGEISENISIEHNPSIF